MAFIWGLQAPEDALHIAREHPNHPFAIELLSFSLNWPKPAEALELLRQFPAGTVRAETLQKHLLYRAGISADPAEFLPWVAVFEGLERQIVLSAVLPAVAMKQPVEALDTAVEHQLESLEIWEKVIERGMNQDAGATLAWLDKADEEFLAVHAGSIVNAWAEHDVTAALDWAAEKGFMGVASTRPPEFDPDPWMEDEVSSGGKTFSRNTAFDYERRTALQQVLAKDPEAALAWLRRQPKGPERDAWIELAAGGAGGDLMLPAEQSSWEFDTLAPLFLALPTEAAEQAVARLMRQPVLSFAEAFRWAGKLPAGPARIQAFIGLGERNGFLFSTDERTNPRDTNFNK